MSINGGEPIDEMATFLRDTDPTSVAGIPGLSLPAGIMQEGLPVRIELDGLTGTDRCLLAMGVAFEQVLSSLPAPML